MEKCVNIGKVRHCVHGKEFEVEECSTPFETVDQYHDISQSSGDGVLHRVCPQPTQWIPLHQKVGRRIYQVCVRPSVDCHSDESGVAIHAVSAEVFNLTLLDFGP